MRKDKVALVSYKKNTVHLIILCILTLLSIVFNMDNFIMGKCSAVNTIITLIYCVYRMFFAITDKMRKYIVATGIWSLLTLITAIIGLFVSAFKLDGGVLMLFAMVFLTPFNGFLGIFSKRWTEVYLMIIVINCALLILEIFNYKKSHNI